MDPNTAVGAYGYNAYSPSVPGGVAIMPETQLGGNSQPGGAIVNIPGQVLSKIGPHPAQNPLFWVLVIALIWTGYVFGGFSIGGGVKKVGRGRAGVRLG